MISRSATMGLLSLAALNLLTVASNKASGDKDPWYARGQRLQLCAKMTNRTRSAVQCGILGATHKGVVAVAMENGSTLTIAPLRPSFLLVVAKRGLTSGAA